MFKMKRFFTLLVIFFTFSSLHALEKCQDIWASGLASTIDGFSFSINSPIPIMYDQHDSALVGTIKDGQINCDDTNTFCSDGGTRTQLTWAPASFSPIPDPRGGNTQMIRHPDGNITLLPVSIVDLEGGETYQIDGKLTLEQGSMINIINYTGVATRLYINGDLVINQDSELNCGGIDIDPNKLVIYVEESVRYKQDSCTGAFVYAVDEVTMENETTVTGSFSGDSFPDVKKGVEVNAVLPTGDFGDLCEPSLGGQLIAEYRMDECSWDGTTGEVIDEKQVYHANISGESNTTFVGKINRSGVFNVDGDASGADAVDVPVAVLDGKSDFSFTAWVMPTQALGAWDAFLSAEDTVGQDNDELLFSTNNDGSQISLRVHGGGNQVNFFNTSLLTVNQWNFIAISKEGAELCMAINDPDTNYQCQTIADGSALSVAELELAHDSAFGSGAFRGLMDEAKFVDGKVDQAKLKEVYDYELAGKNFDGTDRAPVSCSSNHIGLIAEYRFDECFLLGSAYDDVRDNTGNRLDATSLNSVQMDTVNAQINHSAMFDGSSDAISQDSPLLSFNDEMSVSFWVYPTRDGADEYYVSKRAGNQGWYVWFNNRNAGDRIQFRIRLGNNWRNTFINKPSVWLNQWHFITAIYNGSQVKLYVDSLEKVDNRTGSITNSSNPLSIGEYNNGQFFQGNIDEVKLFDIALTDIQRTTLYNNELAGKNYDGTTRESVVCSANTGEKTWQLIGIPAEARAPDTITFDDVFGDDTNDTYFIYGPVYHPTENITDYEIVNGDQVQFGSAYWLTTEFAVTWDVEGLLNVDYDISNNDVDACTDNRCVEIDIVAAVSDDDNSSGTENYTMFGFVGKSPVDWGDCRVIIDGTDIYTIKEASDLDYISRQIWYWTSGLGTGNRGQVLGSDYATCSDASVGGCQLVPFQGYWIETRPGSIGHTVQILLPKGDDQ